MRAVLAAIATVLVFATPSAGGRYKAVRLTTTKVRNTGQNMVQLAELQLCTKGTVYKATPDAEGEVTCDEVADYTTPAFAVTHTESTHCPNEGESADKAADGLVTTKWLDDSMQQSGDTDLTLTFGHTQSAMVEAVGFRFVTAEDEPDRDPVAWRLEGTDGGVGVMWQYKVLHQCADCEAKVPSARNAESQWFAFPDTPAGPKRKADDLDIEGCTAGCAFLIIFFCGGFTYFVAGAAINYKQYEKRGIEVVPHAEFWKDLPMLVKDGVRFAHGKIRGGSNGGAYSTV